MFNHSYQLNEKIQLCVRCTTALNLYLPIKFLTFYTNTCLVFLLRNAFLRLSPWQVFFIHSHKRLITRNGQVASNVQEFVIFNFCQDWGASLHSVQHRIVPVLSFIFSTLCCSTNVYFEAYFKKIIEYNIHNAGIIVCVVQNVSVQKKYHYFISTIFVFQTNKACIPTPQLTAILLKYHTQIIQQFKLDRLVRQSK